MSRAALLDVMVTDADWRVFECLRCGAQPFDPCVAVSDSVHPIGTPMEAIHQARVTGIAPKVKGPKVPKPRPVFPPPGPVLESDLQAAVDLASAAAAVRSAAARREAEGNGDSPLPPLELTEAQLNRFWSKVRRGMMHPTRPELGQCWYWLGARNKRRYGVLSVGGERWAAHRLAYAITYRVPQYNVLHTCDRPGCVNPEHLYEGSAFDNSMDCHRRGRSKRFRTKSPTGFRGVSESKSLRYPGFTARITVLKREIHLGRFDTAEEAARAYDRAAFKYHGALYCADYPIFNFPEEWQ